MATQRRLRFANHGAALAAQALVPREDSGPYIIGRRCSGVIPEADVSVIIATEHDAQSGFWIFLEPEQANRDVEALAVVVDNVTVPDRPRPGGRPSRPTSPGQSNNLGGNSRRP